MTRVRGRLATFDENLHRRHAEVALIAAHIHGEKMLAFVQRGRIEVPLISCWALAMVTNSVSEHLRL